MKVKTYPWLSFGFGTEELDDEQLRQNLSRSMNFMISLLPKGWQNIKSMTVKTTMGKPFKLF